MKNKKNKEIIVLEPPQKSLERILKMEIKVAQEISTAKDKAEHAISAARDEVGDLKESILLAARKEREQMLVAGVDEANIKAQKQIEKAKQSSERFYEHGQKFIDEAIDVVIHYVLDDEGGSK